jgi:hypothetical protein
MASLSIPSQIARGLTRIALLPEQSFRELLVAFQSVPLKIKQIGYFEDPSIEVHTISSGEMADIKEAVFPLVVGLANSTTSLPDYVDGVADSLKEGEKEDLGWAHDEELLNQFKARLSQLISVDSLRLVAKARSVLMKHAQTFSSARIVSDIRPVFGDAVEDSPVGAVIIHMLNIVYYKSGERQDFVVALDTKDIQLLFDALNRATKKTESLESVITSTSMPYIEVV